MKDCLYSIRKWALLYADKPGRVGGIKEKSYAEPLGIRDELLD